jgi:[protein-PII] uridylyltransferase
VAVGGYGRGELSPHSDIDLLFVTGSRASINTAAVRGLLYPLWDAGWQVGHAIRSPKEAIDHAHKDLHFATALLSARLIGGDQQAWIDLRDRRTTWLHKDSRALTKRILDSTYERHRVVERAGWSLAPDLKESIGGLRDVHTIEWLSFIAQQGELDSSLRKARDCLIAVREALHAVLSRPGDTVRIDLQPGIAARLGLEGADDLMRQVHGAARVIEHETGLLLKEIAEVVVGGPRRSGALERLNDDVSIADGALALAGGSDGNDVVRALRLLAARAQTGRPIESRWIAWIKSVFAELRTESWTPEMRAAFFEVLDGRDSSSALELMDHSGAWTALVPEWAHIRGRAQHDAYHRYTVDGHSFVAVGEINMVLQVDAVARRAAEQAGSLETLRLATLLHDIGKGSGRDHSLAGETLARSVCGRMGIDPGAVEEVAALVRLHLLLPDTATRRDLDDGAVISNIAEQVASPRRLGLLYILAAADGRATGPQAWTDWKAALVGELYRKVLIALETGQTPARGDVTVKAREIESFEPALAGRVEGALATLPPSYLDSASVPEMADEMRLLLSPPERGEIRHVIEPGSDSDPALVTLCMEDRPGTLAKAAGVLALNRVSVLRAQAYSTSTGLALERLIVNKPATASWEKLVNDMQACFSGRLALDVHLARKVRDYHAGQEMSCEVRVLQEASTHSSVIEVRAPDALGVLYAIAAGITDLDLDIHAAKIDTLGARVVDVFYVRTPWGTKLDEAQAAELERSICHRITGLFG